MTIHLDAWSAVVGAFCLVAAIVAISIMSRPAEPQLGWWDPPDMRGICAVAAVVLIVGFALAMRGLAALIGW